MRSNSSDSITAGQVFRRLDVDGVVFESSESLELSAEEARNVVSHASAFGFTSRRPRAIRVSADHQKPLEPYALSIVFDRNRKK